MPQYEIRRRLLKAANLPPFNFTATEVQSLVDWFDNLPSAEMTGLLRSGMSFPKDYIQRYLDQEPNREDKDTTDTTPGGAGT